jgi:hypothetical protein
MPSCSSVDRLCAWTQSPSVACVAAVLALVEPPAFVRVDGLLVFDCFMTRFYHAAIAEAELGYHVSYNAPTILIYILVHPGDYNNKVDIFRFIYSGQMVYNLELPESQIIQLD